MVARDPHALVEELFAAAGRDVASEVGRVPGTIVRTARARTGLVRPKIAWVLWESWPVSLEEAFEELDRLREHSGAERALGIFDGSPPPGQAGAVSLRTLDVLSLRRFAFELAAVEQHLAEVQIGLDAQLGEDFLPRTIETEDGRGADAVASIVQWSQSVAKDGLLWIVAEDFGGRGALVGAAALRVGYDFASAPDATRPILPWAMANTAMGQILRREGWAIGDGSQDASIDTAGPSTIVGHRDVSLLQTRPSFAARSTILRIVPIALTEALAWFAKRVPGRARSLASVTSSVPELGALLCRPAALPRWREILSKRWPDDLSSDAEIATKLVVEALDDLPEAREGEPLLAWAFEDAALGTCSVAHEWNEEKPEFLEVRGHLSGSLGLRLIRDHHFTNTLLRDYLVARLLILKLQAGHRDLLTRHQFPREYVLLFLAILSPETAALVSEDRTKTMQAEIAAEVEREVQLALAHNLKHPVALIRGALKDARKKLPPGERDSVAAELSQIDDAARHIVALVDKMNQWSSVPTEPLEPTSLASAISRALTPLRREAPHVQCAVGVIEGLRVQATPEILQVILSNLLENAFQAVEQNGPHRRVTVRAQRTGDTIRVDVIDTGPGVHAADRDRIFEPRVTTKKGGAGRPRGTGMGLPIARKYAHHIGGRLWLDADAPETTFVLELVPARDASNDP